MTGEICRACAKPVADSTGDSWWAASDAIWAKVTGRSDGGGILCIPCFTHKATAVGVRIKWHALADVESGLQRYSCDGEMNADEDGEWVRYADANAEATDLSEDLHLREERILVLSHDLALANARVTVLETLLERTLSAWESYQSTRGE